MQTLLLRRPSPLLAARARLARAVPLDAAAVDASPSPSPPPTVAAAAERKGRAPLFYDAIAFDMDGTLSRAHIPFADMRRRTEIPAGDLFTVMESWEEEEERGSASASASASAASSSGDESDGASSNSSSSGSRSGSGERVRRAMAVILEIEADAAATTAPMEGLADLLRLLERRSVRVALVTRNTPEAVEAFFSRALSAADPSAGAAERARWRALFDPVITRHDRFVKPDRRLLFDLAARWGVAEMGRVLMVGDSLEDVETGNSCGAASCLVAGGGNEAPGSAGAPAAAPPPGAVPTFSVRSLRELRDLLLASAPGGLGPDDGGGAPAPAAAAAASASAVRYGWALGDANAAAAAAAAADPRAPGGPAPGLPFVDWCAARGAFRRASVSFPRIAHAAGGFAACDAGTGDRPDRVLHVGCAEGALTKLLASSGLLCVGADADVSAAQRRGLAAVPLGAGAEGAGVRSRGAAAPSARGLAAGDLERALLARGPFDAVLLLPPGGPLDALSPEAAAEAARVLRPGGAFACELVGSEGRCVEGAEADARTAVDGAGLDVVEVGRVAGGGGDGGASGDVVLRVLARRPE